MPVEYPCVSNTALLNADAENARPKFSTVSVIVGMLVQTLLEPVLGQGRKLLLPGAKLAVTVTNPPLVLGGKVTVQAATAVDALLPVEFTGTGVGQNALNVPSEELKVTVPVGVTPGIVGATVAVKVTACVAVLVLAAEEEVKASVVAVAPTVTVRGTDVDGATVDPR